jgi:trimeric autotransporter adhesin
MKNMFIFFSACATLISPLILQAQVAVTTDGSTPHPSAMFEVKSTNRGMLVPRMTTTQRLAINGPAAGLLVYDTDTQSFWARNSTAWQEIRDGNIQNLADNDNDTKVMVEESTDEDIIRFDIGGAERMALYNNRLELNLGNFNTCIGNGAGRVTTGSNNSFFGHNAGYNNNSGSRNTGSGLKALYSNTSGEDNVAYGSFALFSNISGNGNTASGISALYSNTTGSDNLAIGNLALANNKDGTQHSAIGYLALYNDSTGHSNVAVGTKALYLNYSRSNLVAIGDSALYFNGFGATVSDQAIRNTALGSKALALNTTGSKNMACGYRALYSNISGNENTAGGYQALYSNNSGSSNTANGYQALYLNTSGIYNAGVGFNTLYNNQTGSYNVAVGSAALYYNENGNNNTALGEETGYGTSGSSFSNNTLVGYKAGNDLFNGDNNILIGYQAADNLTTGNNNIIIGYDINTTMAGKSNEMILGHQDMLYGDITNKRIGIGTTYPESQLHIENTGDVTLILNADSDNSSGETDNPRLEMREDAGGVVGAVGLSGADASIYPNTLSNAIYLVNEAAYPVQLGTNSNINLTIRSGGNVGIGLTDPSEDLDIAGNARFRAVASGSYSFPLNLTSTGVLTTSSSDICLKTNVENINDGLERVLDLRGVRFNWKTAPEGRKLIGFIAQEVEQSVPELVYTNPVDGLKGINYAEMTAVLVEAVKEQQKMIEKLQKRVEELERE